ncbi:MAG: hypothetical protein HON04_02995 [Planctomicrobium sp.]|jgi:hypothetical protein|nr:hypothetical protein [Planctomicrobium sp.]
MKSTYGKLTDEQRTRHREIREQIELEKPELKERDQLARQLQKIESVVKSILEIADSNGMVTSNDLEPLREAVSECEI